MYLLTSSVKTEVVIGSQIVSSPRWMLDGRTVLLGPYYSSEEHEQYLGQTVGSTDWLWSASDELRFDQKTLLLQSVSFGVPEANPPSTFSLNVWQTASEEVGLIRLLSTQNFELETTDFRWMDAQGKVLICVNKHAVEDVSQHLKLRINENMELLFADEKLCGWSLLQPTRFIVDAWEKPEIEIEDDEFTKLVSTYLSLFTEPYIEQMEDHNSQVLHALRELYEHASSKDNYSSKRRSILRDATADKLDRFYDVKV